MKALILIAVATLMLFTHSVAQAQEREPLAMRVELEWTIGFTFIGAVVGTALWLTDPGNPNNRLSRSVIEGAAYGAVVGVGFGAYMLQRNAQGPGIAQVNDPLDPMNRPTKDPIAAQMRREDLLAAWDGPGPSGKHGMSIPLANFNWRF
ncbi:MAG TPA: hypothetical protein VF678_00835 [bacterium]